MLVREEEEESVSTGCVRRDGVTLIEKQEGNANCTRLEF